MTDIAERIDHAIERAARLEAQAEGQRIHRQMVAVMALAAGLGQREDIDATGAVGLAENAVWLHPVPPDADPVEHARDLLPDVIGDLEGEAAARRRRGA